MMGIGQPVVVMGAGAFGTALAIALTEEGGKSLLWGRPSAAFDALQAHRENRKHLAGVAFPEGLQFCTDLDQIAPGSVILLAVPTQSLRGLLDAQRAALAGHVLVACCKGVERGTGLLPSQVIADVLPQARIGVLTGPSFAADIARGKPTALTFASLDPAAEALQIQLSRPSLRIYLSDDPIGAQLGGALKNVVAIAAGIAIGAGLGESARAALMTRGFAEMVRFAAHKGARGETLFGLSGFGDLVLTCTSTQSRNLRHGLALGAGTPIDPAVTVEGVMTAHAVAEAAADQDLPVTKMVSAFLKGHCRLDEAIDALLSRPLRREIDPDPA